MGSVKSLGGIIPPMTERSYVVAHDPRHPEGVGAIVSEGKSVTKASRLGATLLPIDSVLEQELAMGGFVKRQFGPDGIVFNANRGQSGCPIALQVRSGVPFVHWAAEVVQRGPSPQGQFRLWVNNGAAQLLSSGLAILNAPPAFRLEGGKLAESIVIRGSARMTGLTDGFMGLGLWGVCTDVAVLWIAVTQAQFAE